MQQCNNNHTPAFRGLITKLCILGFSTSLAGGTGDTVVGTSVYTSRDLRKLTDDESFTEIADLLAAELTTSVVARGLAAADAEASLRFSDAAS